MLDINDILKRLLKLSKKAFKCNEIPVSAIIIYNNKIIASGYNQREAKNDIMAHAEILTVHKAAKKLKRWNLSDCEMYVTLKPCHMCEEVIRQSRIKNVYFLLDKLESKHDFNRTNFQKIENEVFQDTYQQLISNFFQNMR